VNNDSYLLLDIGGEVTDIGIVSNGIIKDSLSFPYGRQTLFRNISKKLNIELRDVYQMFSLFTQDILRQEDKIKFTPVLESQREIWGKFFKDTIKTLPETSILPNIIFLTIDADVKDWFAKIINNGEYIQSTALDKKFTLVTIDGGEFLNMCNVKNGTCDPFLMIEAISVMRKMELYE
jgi:hypothetical protein